MKTIFKRNQARNTTDRHVIFYDYADTFIAGFGFARIYTSVTIK